MKARSGNDTGVGVDMGTSGCVRVGGVDTGDRHRQVGEDIVTRV